MKRVCVVALTLTLLCSLTLSAQTNQVATSDRVEAAVQHNDQPSDSLKVGPNMVHVVARHPDGTMFLDYTSHNLKTTGGIDFLANVISTTGTQPAVAKYLALSTDTTAPAAGDCAAGSAACTLTGEVSTNGLSRTAGTYAHTNGAATYTLVNTWTATGTVTSVQKAAVFNASSSGTMVFENTFTAVTLNVNDTIQVTWTITIS